MKGPSLERQYNKIQEEIQNKIENYKSSEIYKTTKFTDIRDGIVESFQKFDVQEQSYDCADYPGVGSCTVMPIRYSRWELYKFDEEKFEICKTKNPKELNCKECQYCGLWDIDGHYKIPCYNIMKIGIDIY